MKGIQVQIKDYKVANTFDMIKATLKFITLGKDLELSDTELYTLTYFVINGFNTITREDLITTKIIKTKNGVSNMVSKFRRMGILKKEHHKEIISPEYNLPFKDIEGIKIELIIKK